MIYYSKLQIAFTQKSEVYISQKFMKFFLLGAYSDIYKISYAQKRQILTFIIPNCINNFLLRILNLSINVLIFTLISLFLFTKFFTASVITLICALLILYAEIKFLNSKTKILPLELKKLDLCMGQFFNNIFHNVKNVKVSASESVFFDEFLLLQDKKVKLNNKLKFYNMISPYITEPLIIVLLFILLAVISVQNADKVASLIASYALIASAIFRLSPSINRIQNNVIGIKNCMPILTDFFKYYEMFKLDEVDNLASSDSVTEMKQYFELDNINFAYDKKDVIFMIRILGLGLI